jgi:hypothetical protein
MITHHFGVIHKEIPKKTLGLSSSSIAYVVMEKTLEKTLRICEAF